jgi:hypothetical protein
LEEAEEKEGSFQGKKGLCAEGEKNELLLKFF